MAPDGGYADSRLNAATHGIFTSVDLFSDTEKAAFASLHAALVEDYEPRGAQEAIWVRDMAINEWRLGLCFEAECALLAPSSGAADTGPEKRGDQVLAGLDDPRMAKLLRYQTTFDRARKRTYEMLKDRQAARLRRAGKGPSDGGSSVPRRADVRPAPPPEPEVIAPEVIAPEPEVIAPAPEIIAAEPRAPRQAAPPASPERPPADSVADRPRTVDGYIALAGERARRIEDALLEIAAHGPDGYDFALAKLDPRMRRWWGERLAGKRDVGDTGIAIESWERSWIAKPTAAGLREWLKAVRWSDREIARRPL